MKLVLEPRFLFDGSVTEAVGRSADHDHQSEAGHSDFHAEGDHSGTALGGVYVALAGLESFGGGQARGFGRTRFGCRAPGLGGGCRSAGAIVIDDIGIQLIDCVR